MNEGEGIDPAEPNYMLGLKKNPRSWRFCSPISSTYPAGKTSLLMVRGHPEGLHKELHGLFNAVLVVQAQPTHVQRISVCRVHPQDITATHSKEGNLHYSFWPPQAPSSTEVLVLTSLWYTQAKRTEGSSSLVVNAVWMQLPRNTQAAP